MFRGGIYTDSWKSNKLQNSHYSCLKRAVRSKLMLFFFGPSSLVPPHNTGFDIMQIHIYVVQFIIIFFLFILVQAWKKQRKALIIHTSDDANELSQLKYLNDDALLLRKIIHKAIVKKQGWNKEEQSAPHWTVTAGLVRICPAHVGPVRASRIWTSWKLQTNCRCSSGSGEAEVIRNDACVVLAGEMTRIWLSPGPQRWGSQTDLWD